MARKSGRHQKSKPVEQFRCPSCNSMVLTLFSVSGGSSICSSCRAAANRLRDMSRAATTDTEEVTTEPTKEIK